MKTRAKALKKHPARMHSKRAARMHNAHAGHAHASEKRMTADPLTKRLVGATDVEEKAVAFAAQAGIAAIDMFEKMSRFFLGIPTTKRGKLVPRKRPTLNVSAARRGSKAVSPMVTA